MRFDALTLLGTATQATQAALSNALAQLLRGLGKRAAQIGCADAEKKLAALAAENDRVIVAGTGAAAMKDEALAASRAGCPVLLVMDGVKGFAAVRDDIAKAIALLQPCSVYLTGIVVTGADLTRAEEDALNDDFGKNGENPVRIICEDIAQAKDAEDALRILARHADCDILGKRLSADKPVMSPALFELTLAERAREKKQRIVLAEGEEERILRATDVLLRRQIADIILLGDVDAIKAKAASLSLDIAAATLIDPKNSPKYEDYANTFYELRKAKGVTPEDARKTMLDATVYGTMMVKKGDADGMVSGAVNTTAHTIRPALQFVKTRPGFSVVSSCFLMCLKDRVLVFGDCAVNPNPDAKQLAEIAVATAQTAKAFGIEPRVAMLSYSTGKSGKGPDVDVVVEATALAKQMAPDLVIDGPLQYDAAFDPTVAKTKMPNSPVAGKATVFIFPDLNTGNNAYKAVQRAANAIAIGPVLQGLNKPVNDLSRGCLVADIVNTVAITAVQAAQEA